MHSVVVEDPWFGPYIQVQGPDVYTTIRPIVVIGPLFVRVLRVESLDHRGQQLKLNHYHERSVLHNYADGRVTGVIPDDVHPPDGQFWISPTSGQYTYTSPESDPELGEIRIEIKLFVTWKEEELTVTCTLLFEEYLLREPEEDNVLMNKYSITLLGTRDIDPSTGSILYRDFTILVHSQEYQGFSLDDCANPYGAGSDSLGTHLPTLLDYIQQCLWVPHKVKPNRTARDAAIYDAIDNVALANINQLEGVRDLIEFSKLLKSIKGFLRLPGDLQDWLKQFASLHLFWKYVVKTNLMTWEELKKLLAFLTGNWGDVLDKMRNMYLIGHGKDRYTTTVDGYNATVLHNVKVCYGPDMSYFSTIMARLAMLRVVPKFTDMWDMVPTRS